MILNEYETIYVTRPDLESDEQKRLDEKFEAVISEQNGSILIKEEWGKRRLAYEIQKHGFGHYTYLNFVASAGIPSEIERNVRIEDNVIRFLTVKLDDSVDVEECRLLAEERQRKRAEKRAAEAESRAAASSRREGGFRGSSRDDNRNRDDSRGRGGTTEAAAAEAAPAAAEASPAEAKTPEAKTPEAEVAEAGTETKNQQAAE